MDAMIGSRAIAAEPRPRLLQIPPLLVTVAAPIGRRALDADRMGNGATSATPAKAIRSTSRSRGLPAAGRYARQG
jgi:hypothetical protein